MQTSMEGANNFVAEELPQMHIPSFLPSFLRKMSPPPGSSPPTPVRNDPVLLLNNLSASFLSLLQESLSRKERERELTAVEPHFFSSTSQEGSSSLLLPSPQQPLLPPERAHSLTPSLKGKLTSSSLSSYHLQLTKRFRDPGTAL